MNKSKAYTIGYMMALAAVFGTAVTGVQLATRPVLARNAEFADQKALVEVFGLGDADALASTEISELVNTRVDASEVRRDPESGWEFALIKAYEDTDREKLKAYGARFRGPGFWAPIEGILAVSPDLNRTVGIAILAQQETPGLGGRITEQVFTEPFREGVDISPPAAGTQYIHVSTTEPRPGTPAFGRSVDAITGATQTSMAMERILNDFLARFRRAMEAGAKQEKGEGEKPGR